MSGNHTVLAPIMLALWVPITLVLFARLRPTLAAAISIIGSGLLLPAKYAFDLPSLPPLERETVAAIACLLGMGVFHRPRLAERIPFQGTEFLVLVMVLAGVATVFANGDSIDTGKRLLPALKPWDAMPFAAQAVFFYWIPFFLGRVLFRDPSDLRDLFRVFVVAGLLYCLPIFWEARMAPSLHYRIYGVHPAGFVMSKRELFFGWRPMVLVGTGLALSMFMLMAALSAWILRRTAPPSRKNLMTVVAGGLSFFVVMCNSVGTIVYLFLLVPIAGFAGKNLQRITVVSFCTLVLFFPILRATDIFPTDQLVAAAARYSVDRADSLEYRFDNEDILLAKARERPIFGWGGYGRSRVYSPIDGRDISTTDGYWIIVLGQNGAISFIAIFGMLVVPLLRAFLAARERRDRPDTQWVMGAAIMVAISAVDLLPNGSPSIRTIFAAGALTSALDGWPELERRIAARRRARGAGAGRRRGRTRRQDLARPDESWRPGRSPQASPLPAEDPAAAQTAASSSAKRVKAEAPRSLAEALLDQD